MKDKEIKTTYENIKKLILSYRINDSILSLRSFVNSSGISLNLDELDKISETYKYMIHYLIEGFNDSGRNSMLSELRERLFAVNDLIYRTIMLKDSNNFYYEILRMNNFKNVKIKELLDQYGKIASELSLAEAVGNYTQEIRKMREDILARLFNSLLTCYGNDEDYNDLKNYLLSGYCDKYVLAQSISAIILSLLVFYDRSKINFLLDLYEESHDDATIAKLTLGIIFSLIFYSERVNNDGKIKARMELLTDNPNNVKNIKHVLKAIIGTRDTKRISEMMQNEVIPGLMKIRPEIMKSLREGNFDSVSSFGINPEWEEMLEKSGLNDKLRQLSDMQGEGADLLMVTFSNLKNFPFFNYASNWFLPFDADHSQLGLEDEMKKFIEISADAGTNICDSDLYSLALASKSMPAIQKKMFSDQMSANLEQLQEQLKNRSSLDDSKITDEAVKSVRDFYRFFKLFRKHEGFKNPFEQPLSYFELPVLKDIFSNAEFNRIIGEYYFKRGYYGDALPIFIAIAEYESDDASLWEKIGFCYQSVGDINSAKNAYERAELLNQPGPWLTKKLAYVNKRLGNFEKSIEYYLKALDMDPENTSLITNLGNMYLATDNVSAALQQFYHANYIKPDDIKILRALAWIELLNGNITKSSDYYKKIIMDNPQKSDYLNAGHVAFLSGNNKEALNFYRLSAQDNKVEFEKAFMNDLETIIKLGADKTAALLLLDNL